MQWLPAACLLLAVRGGGGATKTPGALGVSQFWTDDYKVFEQIYGKTSDKEIYGATLPPNYGMDGLQLHRQASEKKERYIEQNPISDLEDDQIDPYGFGFKYPSLLNNQQIKLPKIHTTKSPFKFVAANYNPISQDNDPETYRYLKHLEQVQKLKVDFPEADLGGFKPYVSYVGTNPEETDAYKSIQDILEAHEANKEKIQENEETDDQVQYLSYGPQKGRNPGKKVPAQQEKPKPKPPKPPVQNKPKLKPRCPSGRCRKRATNYRVYTRPYVRRIKHKVYYS